MRTAYQFSCPLIDSTKLAVTVCKSLDEEFVTTKLPIKVLDVIMPVLAKSPIRGAPVLGGYSPFDRESYSGVAITMDVLSLPEDIVCQDRTKIPVFISVELAFWFW